MDSTTPLEQKVLEYLAQPVMDEWILWHTKLTRPQLICLIQRFWAAGQITPEMEQRSRSYQLKKHKPKP